MKEKEQDPIIKYLTYKDILIILGLWYFMIVFNLLAQEINLNTISLTNFFHFLFIMAGRFIYLALIIFYLTSFYPINFKELGFNFTDYKRQFVLTFSLLSTLLISIILLINVPLSYLCNDQFFPLYKIISPEIFIQSLIPLLLFFTANIIIGLSEQCLLTIIYRLFNNTLFNNSFSLILASLFYSFLLLSFTPSKILINFIIATISLFLYQKTESILPSSLFIAGYYSYYIFYIYGWQYLRF